MFLKLTPGTYKCMKDALDSTNFDIHMIFCCMPPAKLKLDIYVFCCNCCSTYLVQISPHLFPPNLIS